MLRKSTPLLAMVIAFSTKVSAHHSFASYDIDIKISRTGVLKSMSFTNPHIKFVVEISTAIGGSVMWTRVSEAAA